MFYFTTIMHLANYQIRSNIVNHNILKRPNILMIDLTNCELTYVHTFAKVQNSQYLVLLHYPQPNLKESHFVKHLHFNPSFYTCIYLFYSPIICFSALYASISISQAFSINCNPTLISACRPIISTSTHASILFLSTLCILASCLTNEPSTILTRTPSLNPVDALMHHS